VNYQETKEKELKSRSGPLQSMKLLFVCVGNSCRSQMAEGLAKSMGFEASSAGTHPASSIAEHAATLLESRGISTAGMIPKSIDGMTPSSFDMVISMGCGVHCPAINIDQDWELEDPVGQAYEKYEATAAEIERRLVLLLDQFS
jgi:arsenate reductase